MAHERLTCNSPAKHQARCSGNMRNILLVPAISIRGSTLRGLAHGSPVKHHARRGGKLQAVTLLLLPGAAVV